jgi:hypothetical protein
MLGKTGGLMKLLRTLSGKVFKVMRVCKADMDKDERKIWVTKYPNGKKWTFVIASTDNKRWIKT